MDGVLVIDKPQGVTSHDVVAVARRCLGEKRIGHTGTLDPLATGVLPLACGRATRLVRFLSATDKDYDAVIRFGLTTDSYDITGAETSRSGHTPPAEAIEAALGSLRGTYDQMPPAFSAKRVGGTRAYELARRDDPVQLTAVPVTVSRAQLVSLTADEAVVSLTVSAGFYVRTFAHVLGELTGTGACLAGLRRTRSGDFAVASAVRLDDLTERSAEAKARLLPLERLLPALPAAHLTDEGGRRVSHGQAIEPRHLQPGRTAVLPVAPWVRLVGADGRLLAIGTGTAGVPSLHPAVVLI